MKEMRIPMDIQEFASSDAGTSGVYPCYTNQFQIDTSAGGMASMDSIADRETFGVSFDNGVEEWSPFDMAVIHIFIMRFQGLKDRGTRSDLRIHKRGRSSRKM